MKNTRTILIASILISLFLTACQNSNETTSLIVSSSLTTSESPSSEATTATTSIETTSSESSSETVSEATSEESNPDAPVLDVSATSSVARTNCGIIIYYSATLAEEDITDTVMVQVTKDTTDVTDVVLSVLSSEDESLIFPVFTPTEIGEYEFSISKDEYREAKTITVSDDTSLIYDWTLFDLTPTSHRNIVLGTDIIIYKGSSEKVGKNISRITNWEISFNLTDLTYTGQGKIGTTIAASQADGTWGGWEDLTIGGNTNDDLWGFETSTIGTGWVTYQWRSNWQAPVTTEFMPDPLDATIGCGRSFSEYSQYGVGTHAYKITAETDELGNVTYRYFIDENPEAVHRMPDGHDNINSFDFFQFWSNYGNAMMTDIYVGVSQS